MVKPSTIPQILSFLILLGICEADIFAHSDSRESSKPVAAYFHFDASVPAEIKNVETQDVKHTPINPGDLLKPYARTNLGSLRFDGRKSIISTAMQSNTPGYSENFTWEGFFFVAASNRYQSETGIAHRLITQFVDDKGTYTRLTIGLAAKKKGGTPYLCVSLEGQEGRSFQAGNIEVVPGLWHHFALVHTGTPSAAKINWYLDYQSCGELFLGGQADQNSLKPAGTAPLTIGARLRKGASVNRGFAGLIDEVRLSPKSLRPSEFLHARERVVPRKVTFRFFDNQRITWDPSQITFAETLQYESLSLPGLPHRLARWGTPTKTKYQGFVTSQRIELPKGSYQIRISTHSPALLRIDGATLIDARLIEPVQSQAALQEFVTTYTSDGKPHECELIAIASTEDTSEDVIVSHRPAQPDSADEKVNSSWQLLGSPQEDPDDEASWSIHRWRANRYLERIKPQRIESARKREQLYWKRRHALARQQIQHWPKITAPAGVHPIDALLSKLPEYKKLKPSPLNDSEFIKKLSLDIRGRIPTLTEIETFLKNSHPDKRTRTIDQLLASEEWADSWVGYWQDVFGENPSLVFPTLNNSGAFRRWIYQSFRDNLPFDQFAAELIRMEGNQEVGTAGFALAAKNDVPLAMKGVVIMQAFQAIDLKCARCHDSPIHNDLQQKDLFSLAAMLNDGPLRVPATSIASTIPKPGGPEPLVQTSLKSGEDVSPDWLFKLPGISASSKFQKPTIRTRQQLAAIITSADNKRFAQVIVNRIWQRYLGTAFIEPLDNWNDLEPIEFPPLMQYLTYRFVESGYDIKALARLIVTSQAYQSQAITNFDPKAMAENSDLKRLAYAMPERRRMSAEQLVDSLFLAVGKEYEGETMGLHATDAGAVNLAKPKRAWEFAALPNERGRPALTMPVNQTIVDVLTAFGWEGNRTRPRSRREEAATALQPLILFNGLMSQRIVTLSDKSEITELTLQDIKLNDLIVKLFLKVLSRRPTRQEGKMVSDLLQASFEKRRTGKPKHTSKPLTSFQPDWRVHLKAEQTNLALAAQKRVLLGERPTDRLTPEFREQMEDVLWALINSPEFLLLP